MLTHDEILTRLTTQRQAGGYGDASQLFIDSVLKGRFGETGEPE